MDTILIVDDVASNLNFLFDVLGTQNYKVLYAKSGDTALKRAIVGKPNLILLDVMMPNMDGFETCQRLKQNPQTQNIPIIFMTVLDETENKVRGFDLGAVDYITKPIHSEELLARIQTHLSLYHLQQDLNQSNQALQDFSHTVAHDLKNPLAAIQSMVALMPADEKTRLLGEDAIFIKLIDRETTRAIEIIDSLLLLASANVDELIFEQIDMNQAVESIRMHLQRLLDKSQGDIQIPTPLPMIYSYQPWVLAMLENYISNALKYAGNPPKISVHAQKQNNMIRFCVVDNGTCLSPEQQRHLFRPFSRLYNKKDIEGHGLGLSIVKSISKKLQGEAGVICEQGKGNCFYFSLPDLEMPAFEF